MRNKLVFRIFLSFFLTIMLFGTIVGSLFVLIYAKNTIDNYRSDFIRKTEAIASKLSVFFEKKQDLNKENFHLQMKEADLGLGLYLDFLDDIALSNLWIVDSETQTIHVEFGKYNISYSSIPTEVRGAINVAMSGETAVSERWGNSRFNKNFVIASPIRVPDGTTVAVVVVHARSKAMHENIIDAWYVLLGSLLLALPVSSLLALFFSQAIVDPLKKMAVVTSQMTEGNYTVRTGIQKRDEVGMLANNVDVLAYRLEQASKARAELEQLRKNYISNISHELRTPVAVIRSSLEALCDGIITQEEQVNSYYREMLAESIHLERLVNDLLELSRLQSPDYSIAKRNIDFAAVVEDAVRSCRHIAEHAGHSIRLHKNFTGPIPFYGDFGRLRQMVVTVLDNAIKFSYPGEDIHVTMLRERNDCRIAVTNVGQGISEQELPHVFEEYYKQDSENNRTGTGLGLAIAKRIADRHNIVISATSVPGAETTFSFELPVGFAEHPVQKACESRL